MLFTAMRLHISAGKVSFWTVLKAFVLKPPKTTILPLIRTADCPIVGTYDATEPGKETVKDVECRTKRMGMSNISFYVHVKTHRGKSL